MMNTTDNLKQISGDTTIGEILAEEPIFQQILDLAANPLPDENRWLMYEALKRRARSLVGWNARCEHLKTSRHYDSMIWAIDLLLPAIGEQGTDGSPYVDKWQVCIAEFKDRGRAPGVTSFECVSFRELLDDLLEELAQRRQPRSEQEA